MASGREWSVEFFAGVSEEERQRPKPAFAPKLVDAERLVYEVDEVLPVPLAEISNVRVGGVPWNKIASNPRIGQWAPDLVNGTFQLGCDPAGGEVRCDATV